MSTLSLDQKRPSILLVWSGLVAVMGLAMIGFHRYGPQSTPAARAAAGLPTLITPDLEGAAALVAPEVPAENRAELDELLALQDKRTDAEIAEAKAWDAGAVLRWNEIARGLVSKYNTNPLGASRAFALLSIAQHDALVALTRAGRLHPRSAPAASEPRLKPLFQAHEGSAYPSEHAAIATVSAAVLGFVYSSKEQIALLEKKAAAHEASRLLAGVSRRSDLTAGEAIGRAVAAQVIARAKTDRAAQAGVNWQGEVPKGPDKWFSAEHPPVIPLRPKWSEVRPWLLIRPDQFRPPPPPTIDSPEFKKDLDELRQISKTRTPEQVRIAEFWADSPGSPTPPGHWNRIAAEMLASASVTELGAARVLAFLNMAVMDAGISCWDAKYHYWFLRPTNADPTITVPIGVPNFPSYTSGHSTFSGAASGLLAHFFPREEKSLFAMADEASMSRLYGGIHYRFDAEKGIAGGRGVASLAVERERDTSEGYRPLDR